MEEKASRKERKKEVVEVPRGWRGRRGWGKILGAPLHFPGVEGRWVLPWLWPLPTLPAPPLALPDTPALGGGGGTWQPDAAPSPLSLSSQEEENGAEEEEEETAEDGEEEDEGEEEGGEGQGRLGSKELSQGGFEDLKQG